MPHKNVRFSPSLVALLAGLGCALVLALVALGFAPSLDPLPRALAADSARLEAESMSESSSSIGVVNESAASGGMALKYVANATASKTVALSSDATTLEIRARGTLVSGAWPKVRVFVDGTTYGTHDVATQSVNSSTYKVFSVPVNLKAGQHTVYVRGLSNVTSNRALYVDSLAFTFQETTTTPPPETTATPPPPPGGGPFPGIRWYPTMGVYLGAGAAGFVSEPNLIERQFADYVGPTKGDAYLDLDDGDGERYYFCGGRKYEWDDMLVDQSLAPTSRAQAQDPNWSNYKWTRAGGDAIKEMLDASAAVRDGKAKACIFVATSATAQADAVPLWVENDPGGLTWKDGQQKVHVRMDKTAGWQAMADFLVAVTKRYGGDPRVASITHAEYYPTSTVPTDFNLSVFKSNAKLMWRDWVDAAPRDANGERVTLVQTNPFVAGGQVTASDLQALGMGISGSGAQIFEPTHLDEARRALYGVVPLQHQVNAGSVGDPATFDGTPNPFGIAAGQTVNTQYQHIAWYYSSKKEGTKIPLDSLMMGDSATLIAQWHEAYGKFGPNGSLVQQWGQIPNHPVGSP